MKNYFIDVLSILTYVFLFEKKCIYLFLLMSFNLKTSSPKGNDRSPENKHF